MTETLRSYELTIALRYLRSKNKNRFISFISLISVFGIAIAVAVLIVVLSVMNGFEFEVRERILAVVSHGAITGWEGRLDDWQGLEDGIAAHPEVAAVTPFVGGQGMLVGDAAIKGAEIRGIDPLREASVSGLADLMVKGELSSLESGSYRMVIGTGLVELLDVGVGDRIILIISQGVTTPAGVVPRMRRFEISGIFSAGMYEYDRGLVIVNLADAARLFRLGDAVTGLRISLDDGMRAPTVVRELARSLQRDVYITDWTRQHANFFRSIQLTKSLIFIILLLVVGVAAFNIISTLVMVVREKRGEIAILRTLGASPAGILGLFMTQGTLIGLLGTSGGILLGILVATNIDVVVAALERLLGFRFLAPDVYFISDFPSRVVATDVLQIGAIALALAVLSTIYPAWRGAVTEPAEVLRNE